MAGSEGYTLSSEKIRDLSENRSRCTLMSLPQEPLCEGAQVTIEGVKPKLSCEKCGKLFERKRFSFTCPFCGGSGNPTETGKEFYIKDVELFVEDESDAHGEKGGPA